MKRLSKFEILVGIIGPCVLLPVGAYFGLFFFAVFAPSEALNMEVNAELARIGAEGEPVTLMDLAPPPLADEENAALIYEQAFAEIGEIPEQMTDLLEMQPSELTPEHKDALQDFLAEKAIGFSLLDKAASYKACRFPVDYEEGFVADLPHLSKLRECARLLALKSLLEVDKGNVGQALRTCLQTKNLGESLSIEPFLTSQLTRIGVSHVMLRSLENILSEDDLSAETLNALTEELDVHQRDLRRGLHVALVGERCFFVAFFHDFRSLVPQELQGKNTYEQGLKRFMRSSFMKSDELYGVRMYAKLIDFAQLSTHQAIEQSKKLAKDAAADSLELSGVSFLKPWRLRDLNMFSRLTLPAIAKSFAAWARNEADLQQARIVAAFKIHKIEHGAYPESLDALSPTILDPLPKDPFTGEDFVYRKDGDGFILYSVGDNLKDDGGIPKPKGSCGIGPSDYDIVWQCAK